MPVALLVLWHLGSLHGYEKLLVLLVAFGPFLVLTFVVRHAQRRTLEEDADDADDVSGRPPAT